MKGSDGIMLHDSCIMRLVTGVDEEEHWSLMRRSLLSSSSVTQPLELHSKMKALIYSTW